jgi:DMSO/TMAO reductase YedYZ molybdopterin-dependent catalytic subunit
MKKENRKNRMPPGQQATELFPIYSALGEPNIKKENWFLEIGGLADYKKWNWEEFNKLSMKKIKTDIHCVTRWSKLDTEWEGVLLKDIMKIVNVGPKAKYLIIHSFDGYTTNVPIKDIDGRAMIAIKYDNKPLEIKHGGLARALIPSLYLWKSAKWVNGLKFSDKDEPGFWETRGYHNHGDPWKEERYS